MDLKSWDDPELKLWIAAQILAGMAGADAVSPELNTDWAWRHAEKLLNIYRKERSDG